MKLSQVDGVKHFSKTAKNKEGLRTLLRMYTRDVHRAKLILDCTHVDVSEVSLEQRSRACTIHLRMSIKRLEALGFENSDSYGHLLYSKTMDALAELEEPLTERSLQKCLYQLNRQIRVGYGGDLVYHDRYVPQRDNVG